MLMLLLIRTHLAILLNPTFYSVLFGAFLFSIGAFRPPQVACD